MKAFMSIEQSKKLAEFLPLESADMHLTNSSIKGEMYVEQFKPVLVPYLRAKDSLDAYSKIVNNMIAWEVIPCWSLAALLSILPCNLKIALAINDDCQSNTVKHKYAIGSVEHDKYDCFADNPVDACVDMIIKLHELYLL